MIGLRLCFGFDALFSPASFVSLLTPVSFIFAPAHPNPMLHLVRHLLFPCSPTITIVPPFWQRLASPGYCGRCAFMWEMKMIGGCALTSEKLSEAWYIFGIFLACQVCAKPIPAFWQHATTHVFCNAAHISLHTASHRICTISRSILLILHCNGNWVRLKLDNCASGKALLAMKHK